MTFCAPSGTSTGFLSLLKKSAGTALDEKSNHYLNTICDSAKHMGRLIDDLLAFCRMGRSEMCTKRVNLEELVKEQWRNLALETQGRNIDWKIEPLPEVQADPALLRRSGSISSRTAVKYTGP